MNITVVALISTIGGFLGDLFFNVASNMIAANLQERLDLLVHRQFTNHDIETALFRAWQRSVKFIFSQYRETPDFKNWTPDNQAGLAENEREWCETETFNNIFRAGRQVDLLGGSQDVRDWLARDIPTINRQVLDRLNTLGLGEALPAGLQRRVEDTLTSTLIFNFIEIGIKRDPHSRDAVFYNLLAQTTQNVGMLRTEMTELCNRVQAGMMTHPDLRTWMEGIENQLGGLRQDVTELQGVIRSLSVDIYNLRLAGDGQQADELEHRLEQLIRQSTSDAMQENMSLLLDAVMERFAVLLAHEPEAPVDSVTRLRVFLHGAASRFQSETQSWLDDAVPLETVYVQLNATRKLVEPVSQVMAIDELLNSRRCVLLLGEPGAGKTTTLRALGMRLVRECQVGPEGLTAGKIPVYIPLGQFEELERRKPGALPNQLLAFILRFLPVLPRPAQEALLETGQLTLLLDGLDEVAASLQGQIVREIQDFATCHLGQACRIVVTCRSAPYLKGQDRLADPFQAWTMAPLDIIEKKALIRCWLEAIAGPVRGETLFNELLSEMARHTALERTLRSPLLIAMLLTVYAATRKIEGPAQRYEYLVDVLLLRSKGIRIASITTLEPARRRELAEDKEHLGWLAYRSLQVGGRLEYPAALKELAKLGLAADEADAFLRRMETQAGLIKILAGPGEGLLIFTPHATFQDFFAGYHINLEWRKNSAQVRKFIEKQSGLQAWEAPVGFFLGMITLDAAWPLLMRTLEREPLTATRLLQNSLDLTYEELPRQRREMIFKSLRWLAWELLKPNPGVLLLKLRLLAPNRERAYFGALKKRQEAIEAAGDLHVSEFGPLMVSAALQVPWLMYEFTGAMIKMGPQGLWPELQAWLNTEGDNFGYWAHQVIIQWEGPEAQKVQRFLLEHSEWQRIGLEAFAMRRDTASQGIFQQALTDPDLAQEALALGLQYNCPDLAEAGLNWLEQHPNDTYIFGSKLVNYLAFQPLQQAVPAIRRLLAGGLGLERIRDLFESADEDVLLPLMAIFTEIFKEADEKLRDALEGAIYQMFKCRHLDSLYGDAPEVLEQALLYGNQGLRRYLCKQFSLRPLSNAACTELLERIDVDAPYPAWVESMEALEVTPAVPDPWRERIIAKLRPGLERQETRYYITLLMTRLGAQDDEVTRWLTEFAIPTDHGRSSGDIRAIEAMVESGGPAAFQLAVQGLTGKGGLDSQKSVAAFGRMWPGLNRAQRDQARDLLRKCLRSGDWFMKMQAVDALGRINSLEDANAILEVVSEGTLDPEEPLCGRALGAMSWHVSLEQALWANFQQGNEHMCRTVVHAWRMSGKAQAGRYLVRAISSPSIRTVAHLALHSADLANDYLRGQAACELGWLAADLAEKYCKANLVDGWASIDRELGQDGIESSAQAALSQALACERPGQSLFDQARQARGAQAEMLMSLCAAYEWSEVILALLISKDTDAPAVWERLEGFFDKKNTTECLAEMQAGLALRLNWNRPGLPFENLARLHRQVEYGFQRMVYDFSDYARRWWSWLDWQQDQLR